jgi:hypothetical protein
MTSLETNERELMKRLDRLNNEVATLRHALVEHPSAEALRFVAPFIRDAIAAGVWKAGPGTESVEHELAAALAWLERSEAAT